MLFRDTITDELSRVQFQNMIFNFSPLDPDLIKTRVEFIKRTYKYPIIFFIDSIFISDTEAKSIDELQAYYGELVDIVNSILPQEEQYNIDEKTLLVQYMVLYYYQRSQHRDAYMTEIINYSKDFYKYLDLSFNSEIFEYIKNELLYQLMIFEGQNLESYKDGSLSKLIDYLNSISVKHNSFNPQEKIEVEG